MVERVKCTYCGKVSYTSSPRFANRCSHCNKPFVEPPSGKIRSDAGRGRSERKAGEE